MCTSINEGGKRCDGSLVGHSNHPLAVKVSHEGKWSYDEAILSQDAEAMAHTFIVSARSGYVLSHDLLEVARKNAHLWSSLTPEKKWGFWKQTVETDMPSAVLETLGEADWEKHFPALANIRDVPQDAKWHPEGAVHIHIQQAGDVAAKNATRDGLTGTERQIAVLGAICHDFGKATHTQLHDDGRITSKGHAPAGYHVARDFLRSVNAPEEVRRAVPALVREHMCHANQKTTRRALEGIIERLGKHGATLEHLSRVIEADTGGRSEASESGRGQWFLDLRAEFQRKDEEARNRPKAQVNGNLLQEMGMTPGEHFRGIIEAYKASGLKLEKEHAIRWVEAYVRKNGE